MDVVSAAIWQVLNEVQNDRFKHIPKKAFPFGVSEM